MRLRQQFVEDFIGCTEIALDDLHSAITDANIDDQRTALMTLVGLLELLKSEIARQGDNAENSP
jgi:hypothetical protein